VAGGQGEEEVGSSELGVGGLSQRGGGDGW